MIKAKFKIIYDPEAYDHIKHIEKKYWELIKNKIVEQLSIDPDVETKNRKPLTKPPVDNIWEIRFGPKNSFRVFYKIQFEENEVWILSIGIKIKDKLFIGGREIEL